MASMNKDPKAIQEEVNQVWSAVWRESSPDQMDAFFKHRLFVEGYSVFKKYIPLEAKTILDAGGGSGRYGISFARDFQRLEVTVSDILPEALDIGRRLAARTGVRNVQFDVEDLTALSYREGKFDVVFCDVVIQHISEARMAVCEMYRVLKPGGTLIISAVNTWNVHSLYKIVLKLFGRSYQYGYEKSYSRGSLKSLIEECGFKVTACDGFYPAYGIYRLKNKSWVFGLAGKVLNRLTKFVDFWTNRAVSRFFGMEIICVGVKE